MKLPSLENVKEMRKNMNITQEELSNLSGVSQSLIARIEKNQIDPSYNKVKKIFQALNKENEKNTKIAKDVMNTNIKSISKDEKIKKAAKIMKDHAISQIPVLKDNKVVGVISEKNISHYLAENSQIAEEKIEKYMNPSLPQVNESTSINMVSSLLDHTNAVLVRKGSEIEGIITRADMLKLTK